MRRALLAGLALALAACANLADIDADGRCGNGVIEPQSNEDCEPGLTMPAGFRCGALSDATRCRYVCSFPDRDGVDDCPAGWGCGFEGVCNAPAGVFDRRRTINGLSGDVEVGDFDGDRFPDLVNVAEPVMTVAFGDAEGEFDTLVSVPIDAAPSPPVIGDLEPHGDDAAVAPTDDVIVFAGRRVNIYRGREDQELEPIAVPAGQIGVAAEAVTVVAMRGGEALGRQLAVVAAVGDGALRFVVPAADREAAVQTVPVAGGELAGRLAVADLDAVDPAAGLDAVRDELGWAITGGDRVWVHTLACDFGERGAAPTCGFEQRAEVPVSAGWAVADGVFFGDVDGDGVLDLVAALDQGGRAGIGIAAGRAGAEGFEGFGAMTAIPAPTGMPGAMGPSMAEGRIYAVADLGRGVAEVILDAGAFVFGAGQMRPEPGSFPQFDRPTEDVLPVDFNEDGRVDLLTRSAQSLVLYLNVGGGRFNALESTVPDPFDWMATGDFDGDLLVDLMVASSTGISLAFGDGAGIPTRFVSALDARDPIAALAVVRLTGANFDAIDDVVAVSRPAEGGTTLLALEGSGVGRLTAPFNTPADIRGIAVLGRATRGGAPVASEALIGAMFGGLWSFVTLDWGDLAQGVDVDLLPLPVIGEDCTIGSVDLLFAPVDVEGDGDEEVAALETPPPERVSDGARWVPRLLRVDAEGVRCEALTPATTAAAPQQLVAADLDGDAQPDLLAVQRDGSPGQEAREAVVAVWWGRAGGFEAAPVEYCAAWLTARFSGSLAVTELDGTLGAELVVVGDDGLYALDFGADRAIDCEAARALGVQNIDPNDIRGLTALDVNADGVLDLVISSGERVQIIEQQVCSAQAEADGECARGRAR